MKRQAMKENELRTHGVEIDPDLSLDEARKRGHRYYRGKPCKHGHNGTRYVLNYQCIYCAGESSRKYRRRNEPENTSKAILIDHLKDEKEGDYWDDLLDE